MTDQASSSPSAISRMINQRGSTNRASLKRRRSYGFPSKLSDRNTLAHARTSVNPTLMTVRDQPFKRDRTEGATLHTGPMLIQNISFKSNHPLQPVGSEEEGMDGSVRRLPRGLAAHQASGRQDHPLQKEVSRDEIPIQEGQDRSVAPYVDALAALGPHHRAQDPH
eukprot:4063062-Amphidinium_carterae.1